MPKRISVNTRSAPGNRQRESTKPFMQPSTAETIVEGTTICTLRPIEGPSAVQAADQFEKVHSWGSAQARAALASPGPLRLVITRTYTGISTTTTPRRMTISRSRWSQPRPLRSEREPGAGEGASGEAGREREEVLIGCGSDAAGRDTGRSGTR